MTENSTAEAKTGERHERRECEVCGERVPAATYHEHLLKECPGGEERRER